MPKQVPKPPPLHNELSNFPRLKLVFTQSQNRFKSTTFYKPFSEIDESSRMEQVEL